MTKTVKIKPVGGYVITNPATMQPLPEAGERVEWSNYWQRRLKEGVIAVLVEKKKGGE